MTNNTKIEIPINNDLRDLGVTDFIRYNDNNLIQIIIDRNNDEDFKVFLGPTEKFRKIAIEFQINGRFDDLVERITATQKAQAFIISKLNKMEGEIYSIKAERDN